MKKSILKGTIIITAVSIISRLIGILFRYPVTELIGDIGLGIYQFPIAFFAPIIALLNAPSVAISRLISQKKSQGVSEEGEKIYKVAFKSMFVVGSVVSILMLIAAPILVRTVWSDEMFLPFMMLVPAPILLALTSVLKGYHQGHQNMMPIAMQQLSDGIGRVIVGVFAAYILVQYGVVQGAAGATLGTTAGALAGLIVLVLYQMKTPKQHVIVDGLEKKAIRKKLLSITSPIAISAIGVTLMTLIDTFLMKNRLLQIGYVMEDVLKWTGIIGNVNVLTGIPFVITTAISINALPNIAAARQQGVSYVQTRIRATMIMFVVITLPSSAGLFLVGNRLFAEFFPRQTSNHILVELFSLVLIFKMINIGFTTVLQAQGREKIPVRNMYIALIVKFIMSFILLAIPEIHVNATGLSSIIAYAVMFILNLITCLRLNLRIDFKYMFWIPLLSTSIMTLVVWFVLQVSSSFMITLVAVMVGALVYGICILAFKVVDPRHVPILKRIIK